MNALRYSGNSDNRILPPDLNSQENGKWIWGTQTIALCGRRLPLKKVEASKVGCWWEIAHSLGPSSFEVQFESQLCNLKSITTIDLGLVSLCSGHLTYSPINAHSEGASSFKVLFRPSPVTQLSQEQWLTHWLPKWLHPILVLIWFIDMFNLSRIL